MSIFFVVAGVFNAATIVLLAVVMVRTLLSGSVRLGFRGIVPTYKAMWKFNRGLLIAAGLSCVGFVVSIILDTLGNEVGGVVSAVIAFLIVPLKTAITSIAGGVASYYTQRFLKSRERRPPPPAANG